MRNVILISLSVILPATVLADEVTTTGETQSPPPAYNVLRFDENYSCLTNPANRTDWFDPIKYIPLRTNDPSWYLTLGGELRERFEGNHDPNFGIGGADANPICCNASRCWRTSPRRAGANFHGGHLRCDGRRIAARAAGAARPDRSAIRVS